MHCRLATILALCATLLAAVAATAQGAVRFDREWSIAGGAGGEIGDVALSPDGATVYVADPGFGATGRILVYDTTGRLTTTYEGATGVPIERPAGLGVDAVGNLFVYESDKNDVVVIGTGRSIVRTYAPTGADAFDDLATGITVDAQGLLYVADTRASRISVFNSAGTVVRQIPLGGSFVTDVALDAAGNVYALTIFGTAGCESKVQVYDPSGAKTAEWIATQASVFICARFGIAVDPRTGEVLVSGQGGSTPGVRRFTPAGALVGATLAGNDTPGNSLKATGLAVDAKGAVYVRDANVPRILRFADLPPAPNLAAAIPESADDHEGPEHARGARHGGAALAADLQVRADAGRHQQARPRDRADLQRHPQPAPLRPEDRALHPGRQGRRLRARARPGEDLRRPHPDAHRARGGAGRRAGAQRARAGAHLADRPGHAADHAPALGPTRGRAAVPPARPSRPAARTPRRRTGRAPARASARSRS